MGQGNDGKLNYFDRLFACYAQLDGIYGSYAKSHGEKYLSLWALEEIGDSPEGLSQKEIADKLFAPKQTVSSVVAGLVARGMVETVPSKRDKRSKIQLLTPKGQKLFAEIRQDYDRAEELILKKLGPERMEQMFESFAIMNEALSCVFEKETVDEGAPAKAAPAREASAQEERPAGEKARKEGQTAQEKGTGKEEGELRG